MDASMVIAITAAATGIGGLIVGWRRDTAAARQTAETVATTAANTAVQSLEHALTRQDGDISRLTDRVGVLESERNDCLDRERVLALRIAELER